MGVRYVKSKNISEASKSLILNLNHDPGKNCMCLPL